MSLEVKVSPQVLLNISDHFTRNKIQNPENSNRVLGILLGFMHGRRVKVTDTFEIIYTIGKEDQIQDIDIAFIESKMKLVKKELSGNLFKEIEFLGWYTTSNNTNPYDSDMKYQKLMTKFNENPIYFVIDVKSTIKNKVDLPFHIYETKIDQKDKHETFSSLAVQVEADKAETISIESASRSYNQDAQSQFANNLQTTLNAIQRFNEKIMGLIKQVEGNPKLQQNLLLMRELNEILNSFPVQTHESLDNRLLEQYSDSNIISFFSAISSANRIINDVSNIRQGFNTKLRRHDYL